MQGRLRQRKTHREKEVDISMVVQVDEALELKEMKGRGGISWIWMLR